MKNKATIFLSMCAILFLSAPAQAKMVQGKITGTLSDSMCNGDHSGMIKMGGYGKNAVSCSQKCLKEGSKLVFIDRKTKKIYTLQNTTLAKKFAGKNVVISGHIDSVGKVIHIHSVKPG